MHIGGIGTGSLVATTSVDPDATAAWANACVHDLFEAQVARAPQSIAVRAPDGSEATYKEVDAAANALAGVLRARGVGPDVPVAVFGAKSVDLIVSILGVLKAGGAYVPLDPTYPDERLRYVMVDSGISLVVVGKGARVGAIPEHLERLCVPLPPAHFEAPGQSRCGRPSPANLALVVYTSGSTGLPKGVALTHEGIVSRAVAGYPYRPNDLQKSSINVVAHISDTLLPLAFGGTVLFVAEAVSKDPKQLASTLEACGSSRVVLVPSQLELLLESDDEVLARLARVDTILVSGAAVASEVLSRCPLRLSWISILNGYGVSETTGIVSLAPAAGDEPSVGTPLGHNRLYVLDDRGMPVSAGQVGDVYVAGPQLARGYVRRPALTAERFVADPFAGDGSRMYRTGDVGRLAHDGSISLRGRADREVKVHGFRVNLAEVEQILMRQSGVGGAAVIAEAQPSSARLVAFIKPADHTSFELGAVRQSVRDTTPAYMVPAAYLTVEELPKLPNGKIDYRTLAAARASTEAQADSEDDALSPSSEDAPLTLEVLMSIWQDVLRVRHIAPDDDFLDLGGDSVSGARLLARLAHAHGVELEIADLMGTSTPESLLAMIRERHA